MFIICVVNIGFMLFGVEVLYSFEVFMVDVSFIKF